MAAADDIIDLLSPGAAYLEVWWPDGNLFSDLAATMPSTGSGAVRNYLSQDGEGLKFRNDDTHPGNVPTRGEFPNGAPGVFFTLEPSGPRIISTDDVDLTGSDDGLLFILGVSRGGIDNAFPGRHYGVNSGAVVAFGQHWGEEGDTHSVARTEGPSASVGVAYYDKPTGYHVTTSYHRGGGSPLTLIRMNSTEYERSTGAVGGGGYGDGPIFLGCLGGDKSFGLFGPYIVRRGTLPSDEVLEAVEALVLAYGTGTYPPDEPDYLDAPAARYALHYPLPSLVWGYARAAPPARYGLRFPLPSLTRSRRLDAPAARLGLSFPLPSLQIARVLEAPASRLGLRFPLPSLTSGRSLAAPAVRYGLRFPLPRLETHRNLHAPVARYGLAFPLPELSYGAILDAPAARYALRFPLPSLVSGAVLEAPAARYALGFPVPSLRFAVSLDAPAARYGLRFPVPVLISPDSSRRRVAYPGDSANGGIFTSRAPGRLVSDGITGGTIERD